MNKVKDKLPALVEEELAAAMEEHPLFASVHEGYAVTLEEVEEAEAELRNVRLHLCMLWRGVRHDNLRTVARAADVIKKAATCLAAEAIQVAAMAQKLLASLDNAKPRKVAAMAVLDNTEPEKVAP